MVRAVPVLFSSDFHRDVFFQPLQKLHSQMQPSMPQSSLQADYLEPDLLAAGSLVPLRDTLDCSSLLLALDVTNIRTI